MTNFKAFRLAVCAALCLVGASLTTLASAQTSMITFDALAAGTVVTNQFAGVTISLLGAPIAGPRTYALQDTSGVPQSIFGASGNAITPGDNVGGINAPFYDFQFVFSQAIDYFSLMALDAEEPVSATSFLGGAVIGLVLQGTLLGNNVASVFNGPVYLLELGSIGGLQLFDRVTISLDTNGGPELFDNLTFHSVSPVPEPEIYAMMGVGLALLGWVRRRKLKAAA